MSRILDLISHKSKQQKHKKKSCCPFIVVPRFTNLIYFTILGTMATFVSVGKVATVVFVTQCGVGECKQNSVECFCLRTELFGKRNVHERW